MQIETQAASQTEKAGFYIPKLVEVDAEGDFLGSISMDIDDVSNLDQISKEVLEGFVCVVCSRIPLKPVQCCVCQSIHCAKCFQKCPKCDVRCSKGHELKAIDKCPYGSLSVYKTAASCDNCKGDV